jgi:hypothetical protein
MLESRKNTKGRDNESKQSKLVEQLAAMVVRSGCHDIAAAAHEQPNRK